MIASAYGYAMCASAPSAWAPNTLLMANQPTPAKNASTAGTTLPSRPKARREITICGMPKRGPPRDSRPTTA